MEFIQLHNSGTHRQEDITTVHQHHDKAPNPREIVSVTCKHEYDGDNMMRHHLDMILPSGLGIEDQYLMKVEGSLDEVIKLEGTSKGEMGVIRPQICWVQDTGRKVMMHIL